MAVLIFSGCAPASLSTVLLLLLLLSFPSVVLSEERGVSPRVEGHATNSCHPPHPTPPLPFLKTMKSLIQDARLVHSAFGPETGCRAIIMSLECHNLPCCPRELIRWQRARGPIPSIKGHLAVSAVPGLHSSFISPFVPGPKD